MTTSLVLCGLLAGPAVAPSAAATGQAPALAHGKTTAEPTPPVPSETSGPDGQRKRPTPPATMSTVGGALLGKPGVQVNPTSKAPAIPKKLSALSWMISDADTGDVLAANNAHWELPPASTLKMLFADTVLPKFDRNQKHRVVPHDLDGMGEGSSQVGIKEKQVYSVHDLWNGVFLRSGNDAVHVLCAMNGGVQATVKQMRAHARKIGAKDTHVRSPDGYDAPGQVSSAYDLTLFAREGMQNPDFRSYVSTRTAQFPGKEPKKGKRPTFTIQNTNRLLGSYPGMIGVKNGYTTNAGNTFTGAARRDGHTLLVTVLHPTKTAPDEVYKESSKLLDWGFSARDTVQPVGTLQQKHHGSSFDQVGGSGGHHHQAAAENGHGIGTWGLVGVAVTIVAAGGGVLWYLRVRRPRQPGSAS